LGFIAKRLRLRVEDTRGMAAIVNGVAVLLLPGVLIDVGLTVRPSNHSWTGLTVMRLSVAGEFLKLKHYPRPSKLPDTWQ
jgi:hypothetical protein